MDGFSSMAKYHSSWDWLMPVIEKITDMKIYYSDYKAETSSLFDDGGIFINTKFISSTWEDVIAFIEWYNANNK
jgi:Tfp pilus assembly protein PilZ